MPAFAADAKGPKTPIDADEKKVEAPEDGPAVVPGAATVPPPRSKPSAGGGADMGPAGGPDGAGED